MLNSYSLVQGLSTTRLTPMEVLAAIQHAQIRLDKEFTKEEFLDGKIGGFMIPEDFNFEETVRHKPFHNSRFDPHPSYKNLPSPFREIHNR